MWDHLSPKDTLVLARNISYELALIDWHMPEMDGVQLIKLMKHEFNVNKKIKTILVTPENNRKKVMAAIKAGVHRYIVKPPSKENILAQIESLWPQQDQSLKTIKKFKYNTIKQHS